MTFTALGQIRELIRKLADERRSATLQELAGDIYAGIPEDRHAEIVLDVIKAELDRNVDRRGAPKGQTQEWHATRYELRRGNKKRTRVGVRLEYCADGWHSDSGSRWEPSEGGPICHTMPAGGIVGEDYPWKEEGMDAWREFHESRPVRWKVHRSGPGRNAVEWYCDDELPEEYRRIATGQGNLDGYETPAWALALEESAS